MDKYFRAVGFSQLQAGKQLDTLIQTSFRTCETKYRTELNKGDISLDCFKYYGKGIGLGLSGKMNKNNSVVLQKCFPFAESKCRVAALNVEIEDINHDKLALFYDKKNLNQFVVKLQTSVLAPREIKKLSVTALSAKGKILLPLCVEKTHAAIKKQESKNLRKLIKRTCTGDPKAVKLLEEHIDKSSLAIKNRMHNEDFFSIVESYFQPNDESDFSYDLLANIIDVETIVNSMTDEKLYSMTLDVTGTKIQLYINHSDLIGIPTKGMRFWGVCALNGNVINDGFLGNLKRIFSFK